VLFDTEGLHSNLYRTDGQLPPAITVIEQFIEAHAITSTNRVRSSGATTAEVAEVKDKLSPREVDVLRLLAAGRSNQQIADELVISLNTVRRHVSNIFDKTDVTNRAQAAVYARDHSIV
jgi:DNA-binding NarL/FixJ family response regulator